MSTWSTEYITDKKNFEIRGELVKLISAMIEIGYDNEKICDILMFGIENITEIREFNVFFKAHDEVMEEQYGKE